MDLKRFHNSDQLPYYSTSPRKKVVSRFGLGIVFSVILIILGSYHISIRASFFDSVWEGFNGNSTSPPFWSFSFSATSCFYSCRKVTSSSSPSPSASPFSVHDTLVEELKHSAVGNGSFENVTKNSYLNGNQSMDSSENGVVMNNTRKGKNTSRKKNKGSVDLKGPEKSPELVKTEVDKIANLSNVTVSNSPKMENVSVDAGKENAASEKHLGISKSFYGDCDIFDGRWVKDDSKPYYPPGSCPYIDRDFDCHRNKRPDAGYVNWRWQPHGCDIPR